MKYTKRALALFLALCLTFTSVPLSANATETVPGTAATGETVQDSTETVLGDETSETDSEGAETDGTGTTVEGESETEAGTTVDASEENKDTTVDGGSEDETDNTSTALDTPEEANDKVAVASVTAEDAVENTPVTYASVEEDVAETAADNTDYLFFATDRHANTSVIGNIINNMETSIGENELDYLGLGGDMVGSGDNHPAYNSSTVLAEVTGATSSLTVENVDIVAGIHDMNCMDDVGILLPYKNGGAQIYEGDRFYVYGVEEYCISEDSDKDNWSKQAEAFVEWANGDTIDKDKVIIVLSHYPLHVKRDDNDGAVYWHNALNTIATGDGTEVIRNVAFFHGHNHTVDSLEYAYAVGTQMDIQGGDTGSTIYYTYATAGYLNQNNKATLVTIDDSTISFTKYGTSGSETEMVEDVTRVTSSGEDTDVTLQNISVSGNTNYTVGADLNITVTANYSNQTTKDVTSECTITGYDKNSVGTQTLNITYEENGVSKEATYEVTVSEQISGDDSTTDKTVHIEASGTVEKTVYKLVDTVTSGNNYLIVDSNVAGSGNALINTSNNVGNTTVTIVSENMNGETIDYIESDNTNAVWTAGTKSSSSTFINGSYYLYHDNGKLSLSNSTKKNNWNFSTNQLYYTGGRENYYLTYNNGWTLDTSSTNANVYLYEETTIPSTTNVAGTYSIAGNPTIVEKVVSEDATTELGYTITFTPDNGTTITVDTSELGGTVTFSVLKNEQNIVKLIDGNELTFTGDFGEATVKVSYTWTTDDGTKYTIWDTIAVVAKEPTYSIDITETVNETEVSVEDTIVVKGVEANDTYELNNAIYYEDATGKNEVAEESIDKTKLTWVSSNTKIAAVDGDGTVTFTGAEGTVQITVLYEYADGKSVTDVVTFSVSKSQYVLPSDGTDDFPEYPNEGAIRYDKTATAVGNFSQTGIAQVELSMTGVPYTTGSEIDVVMMLDMTGSMSDDAMAAAEEAAIVFAESIVKNEDGTYNNNRISILAFNSGSSSPYELWPLGVITEDTWDDFCTAVRTASDKQVSGGTPYDKALEKCQSVLANAKTDGIGNERQQFCVFMSDGGPTSYQYITNYDEVKAGTATAYTTSSASATGGANQSDSNFATIAGYTHEYYSTLMKDDGVTVYTVGTGLTTSSYPNCCTILENIATDSSKAYVVESSEDTASLKTAFTNIAVEIKQAATNVVVQDKVADEYTMVFDIPTGTKDITGLDDQEFYIEVKEYTLDADHERTSTYTSLAKVYLGEKNGTYYAASDANGTAYASPVFTAVEDGQKGYYSIVGSTYAAAEDEIVIKVDDTYYLFVADGTGTHNMTSGAYAYGTIDSTTNMSTDLVIVTPYFCYSAATRMLAWTAEKLTTTELALSYFLYLDESATEVGTDNEVDSATYPTNDYATITYTNYRGKECQQVFPIPQLTWNGAQVSYVFYLVNEYGQPVNRAGKVVPFAEAVYVTDVVTYAVTWNKDSSEGTESLDAAYLAEDLVPDVYALYDEAAEYEIHVYETNTNTAINDYFIIKGSASGTNNESAELTVTNLETTKVFNTKAGDRYSTYGAYSATAGTYTDTDNTDQYTVTEEAAQEMAGFDFANTTVAFAVVWKPELVEDTVVVDYGLPVIIDVATNDALASGVVGVRKDAPANVTLNSGQYNAAKATSAALTHGTATVENLTSVRYELSDMTISAPEVFYYESDVNYYDNKGTATLNTTSMYSSVTVIPATTVYYEDSFVTYKDSTAAYSAKDETTGAETYYGTWADDGTEDVATQATDRPGTSTITGLLDANNNYGYDAAYDNCTEYSMGSAKKVTVNTTTGAKGSNPSAAFTFNGTGFDLVSLTDNTSGMIKVTVKDSAGTTVKTMSVNNYYGYTYSEENGWVTTDSANPNVLYQVPVIQITDLPQATYTVTVDVMYMSSMDSTGNGEYNFWLDAVRVYDPASTSNTIINAAYTADNELNPGYIELRDLLLAADDLDASAETAQDGAVFIDGMPKAEIADYEAYGPNNEVYLTKGQAVAFKMIADVKPQGIQIGAKLAQGTSADLYLNVSPFQTLNSATDRNYVLDNITWTQNESGYYESDLIVFSNNSENSIISLTNLKAINAVFVTSNSAAAASVMSLDLEDETAENTAAQISVVSSYALARTALDIVNSIDKVVFVPESLEASWSSLAVAGRKATLTVITSEDVEAIDVDGTMITEYKTKKVYSGTFGDYTVSTKRVWTYTITAPEKGTYEYDVIAYDADGNESEPVTTTLNVKGSIWESLFPWLS